MIHSKRPVLLLLALVCSASLIFAGASSSSSVSASASVSSVRADRAAAAKDSNGAIPGLSHVKTDAVRRRRRALQEDMQQVVGTTVYNNEAVASDNANERQEAGVTMNLPSAEAEAESEGDTNNAAADAATLENPEIDDAETAVIDSQLDEFVDDLPEEIEQFLDDLPDDLPLDDEEEPTELEQQDEEATEPAESTEEVSCMDWIPTDPSTPPASYVHCYDGTYAYTLTPTSRPARCSPQHFNLGQYNYQQILQANTVGASPSDEWTVCAHWFNLHAGLPTRYEDLSRANLYPLSKIGNGGTYDLPACTGDCDSDAECQPGLYCLQRTLNSGRSVLFCDGLAEDRVDYCIPERYRDVTFDEDVYLAELEMAMQQQNEVETTATANPDGGMDSADETDVPAAEIEESDGQTEHDAGIVDAETPADTVAAVDEETAEEVEEEPTADPPSTAVDEPQDDSTPEDTPTTNDPGPAIEEAQDEEPVYNAPGDRPKTFPIELKLPSFFIAIDVRIRNSNKLRRHLQNVEADIVEDPTRFAEPTIDIDALRIALQNVLYATISTLDERLWGVTVQPTNVDNVALTLPNGRAANREFFSVHAQAIFLVLETGDGTDIAALDAAPLPDEDQLRAAMELALQENNLLNEFAEAKGRTKLPRATNVGASFMDGSPISGIYDEAEADSATANIADSEAVVGAISPSSSGEEGSFFSTFTISVIAGACGALVFVIGGAAIYSRRRALRKSKEEDLSPRSRSFPQHKSGSKYTFAGGDKADPDPMKQTFSGDTHPASPSSSTKEEEEKKKQKMDKYFDKLENVESQPEPSIEDGESDFDFDASQYTESECGMTMSEWSVNDIGKDHVQLTDKPALKPEKSIASMGKRMRQALGHAPSSYAESEADVSYADTENMSALGDFRLGGLGSVLGDDMSELGNNTTELNGIAEEADGDYTPHKSNKSEFSALWKSRTEGDTSKLASTEDVSPAKSIEDSVLGVSLTETNRVIRRMKEENATNSFLDVSHHAPRFDIDNASTDSEAEDESMLFHKLDAPPTQSEAIPEVDKESDSDVASSNKDSSTTRSAMGSIIGSILGNKSESTHKKPEDNLESLRYLDNSMTDNTSKRASGEQTIDDDVTLQSNADTSVDGSLLDRTAKDVNLLSEVASSNGTEDEPRFFQLDMPAAYRLNGTGEGEDGDDEESVSGTSYAGSFHEM